MSTQELLTFLFNAKPCVRACAIALGFITIASIDFGTRLVIAYKQISIALDSPSTSTQKPISKLPIAVKPQELGQLPDPWLLPVEENPLLLQMPSTEFLKGEDKAKIASTILLTHEQQKHLRLLPPAKALNVSNPELEDLLRGVDLENLKLRQARKIAKLLGIAQKVDGKGQKVAFLVSQIKSKLRQETSLQLKVMKAFEAALVS